MNELVSTLNGLVWSPALIYLCLGVGLYFSLRGRFLQVRHFKEMIRLMFTGKTDEHGVSWRISQPLAGIRVCADSQRLQRALEICLLSGRKMSELLAESESTKPPYDFLSIGLLPSDRSVLHARIARRFDEMLLAGLDDEVRMLRAKYDLNLGLPSMRCVGYRQVWEAQEGLYGKPEMRDRGIYATRQLAKRQITWLRSMPQRHAIACDQPHAVAHLVQTVLQRLEQRTP